MLEEAKNEVYSGMKYRGIPVPRYGPGQPAPYSDLQYMAAKWGIEDGITGRTGAKGGASWPPTYGEVMADWI